MPWVAIGMEDECLKRMYQAARFLLQVKALS
ncbi:MAG: hypothetical protein ACI843_002571 [Psychrobacter glaciei]|jgi:hypothetical protein